MLAFYVGGLKPDEPPNLAYARALNYQSEEEYANAIDKVVLSGRDLLEINKRLPAAGIDAERAPADALFDAFFKFVKELPEQCSNWPELQELDKRLRAAEHRLYAQVGIDAERAPADALFDALFKFANELPEQWLNRLESDLENFDCYLILGPGTRLPIVFPSGKGSRNSRVFTQKAQS